MSDPLLRCPDCGHIHLPGHDCVDLVTDGGRDVANNSPKAERCSGCNTPLWDHEKPAGKCMSCAAKLRRLQ